MYNFILGDTEMTRQKRRLLKRFSKLIMVLQTIFLAYVAYVLMNTILLTGTMKIIIIVIILFINFVIMCMMAINFNKNKIKLLIFSYILLLITSGLTYTATSMVASANKAIDNITGKQYMNVNSDFLALKDSDIKKISDLANKNIGLLMNVKDYEGYILPQAALKKAKLTATIKYVSSYAELISGLADGTYDTIAVPSSYKTSLQLSDDLKSDLDKFVSIHSMEDKVLVNKDIEQNVSADEPFNIVLIGTDSPLETITIITMC